MKKECDVLVVGAGVAGATCATILDKLGINNVYLIERCKEIGISHSSKIDFAEDKGLKILLNKYNLPILKETNISRWFAPNQDMFELKSHIHDIWFKRGDTDSFESEILKKTNVNIILNTDVIDISNGDIIIQNRTTKEKIVYKPRIIVIATGNHLPYFNNDKKDKITQEMYAYGFVVDQLDIDSDIPHIFFDDQLFHGSYLYMLQNSEDDLGYLAYGSLLKDELTVEKLSKNRIIDQALSKSKIKRKISGTLYAGKQCSLTDANKLFIGDAANLMDPFLSYGVTNSVKSGVFAAEAIANGTNIMEQYEMRVHKEISPELQKQIQMRKLFNKLDDPDINSIVKLFNGLNDEGKIEELFNNLPELFVRATPLILKDPRLLKILFKGIGCII